MHFFAQLKKKRGCNHVWAIGIKSKAVTQSIAKCYKDLLDQSGYEGEKITMRSDREPSILALKRAVAAARSGEPVPIESAVRSSKAMKNGGRHKNMARSN